MVGCTRTIFCVSDAHSWELCAAHTSACCTTMFYTFVLLDFCSTFFRTIDTLSSVLNTRNTKLSPLCVILSCYAHILWPCVKQRRIESKYVLCVECRIQWVALQSMTHVKIYQMCSTHFKSLVCTAFSLYIQQCIVSVQALCIVYCVCIRVKLHGWHTLQHNCLYLYLSTICIVFVFVYNMYCICICICICVQYVL